MNCTSYYVDASHHFKHDLVYSSNSLKAGVSCHSPIYRWVGGRGQEESPGPPKAPSVRFAAPHCSELRTTEKLKVAFALAHVFTRTWCARERKQKLTQIVPPARSLLW